MAVDPSKTRTWNLDTPNNGDFFELEFNRIYSNTNDLQNQVANVANFQIPLGGITEDPLNILPTANFRDVNGASFLRADAPALIALLIKSVTSMNASTDRINVTAHGKTEGELVKFGFTIGGITALTHYFVRNPTTNDFQVSLTASGSIVNITADGTGEMLTNVEWGFGNGSTTANVPDRRGIFERNWGVHGSRAKAAGGNYDGGAVGSEGQDRFQGHWHATYQLSGASGNAFGNASANTLSTQTTIAQSREAIADGVNGTPRMGNETTPAWISVREKVRIA
jgi:hypothetical protein